MIIGLDIFRDYFKDYSDQYVLIGGAACYLSMDEAGLPFRATQDLDIVLCVETITTGFVKDFWNFVHSGSYSLKEKGEGKRQFYRFQNPATEGYPKILELFSRVPDALNINNGHLTPIPVDDSVSSLSAILLDETYYNWIHSGKQDIEGIRIVDAKHLIPLKARAFLDLTQRKNEGSPVDSKSIKKHKNDIFRLYQLLTSESLTHTPPPIKNDLANFLRAMDTEDIPLKALGLTNTSWKKIRQDMVTVYEL